jgi:hypothetical protein
MPKEALLKEEDSKKETIGAQKEEKETVETWEETDSAIEDLIWDISPVEIKKDIGSMIEDIREHILDQFEKYDIAERDEINLYMEDDSIDLPRSLMDLSDPDEDINILD